ncbi:MAG: type I 3-dehydroquinate dehydratase [Clostridiales bacterium]|nr:type I 3-dehydroquinate dehydratase [Clostridiales bacterium]
MRLQAQMPIKLRNKLLGGKKPLICIPIISEDETHLVDEVNKVIKMKPDAIEWRVDYFESIKDFSKVNHILKIIRIKTDDIPIILTCRSHEEGGYKNIDDEVKLKLFEGAIKSGYVDAIDIELAFGKEKIEHIKSLATKKGVKLILSYHNFVETPSEEFMMRKIKEEITYGADIPKIAVMPKEQGDVLKLLSVTYNARKKISNPLITVSMGSLGFISRFVGCIFGSDMTFASGVNESAPGQMPIEEMRRFIEIII